MNLLARVAKLEAEIGTAGCPECARGYFRVIDDPAPGEPAVYPTRCEACGRDLVPWTKFYFRSTWDALGIGP